MWAHPGKQLLFMGAELAPEREWDHEQELDWWIAEHWEAHRGVRDLLRSLNGLYRELPALWSHDDTPEGFQWVDADDSDQSVISFLRLRAEGQSDGAVLCVANLTPVPRYDYRVGLPAGGWWREVLNSDAREFGGGGLGNLGGVEAEDQPWHGRRWSARLTLPPLAVVWLSPT
jgi:1,4-alpha-glucan branching enzyme